MSFSDLGLSPKVLEAVTAAGYTIPTAIQAQAIPHALQRKDVMGLAQTGSGKTAAFVLPMLSMLESGRARARMPRTLILEPTRELAAQVEESFATLGKNHKLTVALLIGGVAFDPQAAKIDRGADVVIATPGRLLDHFERGRLLMTGIEMLVIDEADRMLDMGFIPDIERICKLLPFTRQTMFFSATMPPEIQRLTAQFLHNPVRIETAVRSSTAESIEQNLVKVPHDPKLKRDALRALIRTQESGIKNAIVFANRKTTVALLEKSLKKHGFNAGALHGDMDQSARTKTLAAFRANELTFLIASDVAARGLDIPDVSHVFNFDVPTHSEDYVHRVGRTGRAGREGHAFTMVTREEQKYLSAILDLIKKDLPYFELPGGTGTREEDTEAGKTRSRGPARGRGSRENVKKETTAQGQATKPRVEKPEPQQPPERQPTLESQATPERKADPKPQQRDNRRGGNDDAVQDASGFHAGNMPAFLTRR